MANLSDLALPLQSAKLPEWIATLAASSGFIERGSPAGNGAAHQLPDDPAAAAHDAAIEQAYQAGEAAGRAWVEGELAARDAAREQLRCALVRLEETAIQSLRRQLAETVASLCENVMAPLVLDRDALLLRCEEAARLIGEAPARCALHLHPDDVALLDPQWAAAWQIKTDSTLQRGSLKLEGPDGTISDGPEEWRRAIIAALMP